MTTGAFEEALTTNTATKGYTSLISAELTRPSNTDAYSANDSVSNSATTTVPMTLANVARSNGGNGYITGIRISTNKKSITPRLRLHLFNAADATLAADNAAHKEVYADSSKRLGYIDLPAMTTAANTTDSDMSRTLDFTQRIPFQCAAASTSLYAVIETLDAFNPDSGQKFNVTLNVEQN